MRCIQKVVDIKRNKNSQQLQNVGLIQQTKPNLLELAILFEYSLKQIDICVELVSFFTQLYHFNFRQENRFFGNIKTYIYSCHIRNYCSQTHEYIFVCVSVNIDNIPSLKSKQFPDGSFHYNRSDTTTEIFTNRQVKYLCPIIRLENSII